MGPSQAGSDIVLPVNTKSKKSPDPETQSSPKRAVQHSTGRSNQPSSVTGVGETPRVNRLPPYLLEPVMHMDFTIAHQEGNPIEALLTAQAETRPACYIIPDEISRNETEEGKKNRLTSALELMKAQFLTALEENKRQRARNIEQEMRAAAQLGVKKTDPNQDSEWIRKGKQLRATGKDGWDSVGTSKAEMLLNDHRATLMEVMTDTYNLKQKMWWLWSQK
jgi:hypothetical protein